MERSQRSQSRRSGGGARQRRIGLYGSRQAGSCRNGLAETLGEGPTPAFAAEMAEQCERLLDLLGDNQLRSIAIMKMDGYTVAEIAQELSCGHRTVERSLRAIRAKWSTALAHPE